MLFRARIEKGGRRRTARRPCRSIAQSTRRAVDAGRPPGASPHTPPRRKGRERMHSLARLFRGFARGRKSIAGFAKPSLPPCRRKFLFESQALAGTRQGRTGSSTRMERLEQSDARYNLGGRCSSRESSTRTGRSCSSDVAIKYLGVCQAPAAVSPART